MPALPLGTSPRTAPVSTPGLEPFLEKTEAQGRRHPSPCGLGVSESLTFGLKLESGSFAEVRLVLVRVLTIQ